MDSHLFDKLQKFDCTASSQDAFEPQKSPLTTSQIFMSHQQSNSSARHSFSQKKSSFRTQPLTQSQTTSSTQVVQNICNQIKYLIEGNLKSNNNQCNMTDFVRQNVIPMLIKMFFQTPKTDFSMGDSFGNPKEQLKDITNNFGIKRAWKTDTFMKEEERRQDFSDSLKSACNEKTHIEELQNSEKDLNVDQKISQISSDQKSLEGQNSSLNLTSTLCMSILLLKTLVVRKLSSFERIKLFVEFKQKKIEQFIFMVRKTHIKNCVSKFRQNKTLKLKQTHEAQMKKQVRKFDEKRMSLSCQLMGKIIRMNLKSYFKTFKENSFSQNKFMRQWVRYAALRSPLTVKTSIWRLKQFMNVEDPQQHNCLQDQAQENKKIEEKINITDREKSPKISHRKVTEPDVSQIDSQSQEGESISSDEFQKMFECQKDEEVVKQSLNRPSLDLMALENRNKMLEQIIQEQKKFQDDEYLRTISEDQHENQYMAE